MSVKKRLLLQVLFFVFSGTTAATAQDYELYSPDKKIHVNIHSGEKLGYEIHFKDRQVLLPSLLSMTLSDGKSLGVKNTVINQTRRNVNRKIKPLYGMASSYDEMFNELDLGFKGDFHVIFRAFNNGLAYRFATALPGRIKVGDEQIDYHFGQDCDAWMQTTTGFHFGYEAPYLPGKLTSVSGTKMASLPLIVNSGGLKVAITEADLLDYPGYYLVYKGNLTLSAVNPRVVTKDSIGGQSNFDKIPYQRADYIAETDGARNFPWRVLTVVENDKDLLYNNLNYLLSSENKIGDVSWVKPGKVSWDWWNANNLSGVNFKSGFNMDTYKYFIDFAAKNKLEYIMMDEGWSDQFNLLKVNDGTVVTGGPDVNSGSSKLSGKLDMPYLVKYAKEKGVGIIVWCVWHTLDRQMEVALDQFQKWGIKGVKVDFMNRDDQTVVNFYERLARETAKRKMVVDFHAAFKPTGLERTYPNILNFEAVQGLEWAKFDHIDQVTQAVVIPFTRMLAGPMDYTPGGMSNANKEDFRMNFFRPMTQGTRCNQLAMFTMYYAPLEMLADSPTAYEKEPEILSYLANMPNTWDETIPLDGSVGNYAVIARRKGGDWYVSGLNNWEGKKIRLDLSFLDEGNFTATLFKDGPNADRIGNDYVKSEEKVSRLTSMEIAMANGGGFAIKISKGH